MYVIDGIAYAEQPITAPKVTGVRPLKDWRLWLRFNNSEVKIYDFKPLLNDEAFKPLQDVALFNNCYIDFGGVMWCDGDIDIAPEELYKNSVPLMGQKIIDGVNTLRDGCAPAEAVAW